MLVRTTDVFDNESIPAGLLRVHRIAAGTWGRLVVHSGSIRFVFEDDPDDEITVAAGQGIVIPPASPHRVRLSEQASFAVEFYTRQT